MAIYPECRPKATLADVRALGAIVNRHGRKRRAHRVERQPRGRFAYLDVDQFDAAQCQILGIGPQLDRVVDRYDRFRQLARRRVEEKTGSVVQCSR